MFIRDAPMVRQRDVVRLVLRVTASLYARSEPRRNRKIISEMERIARWMAKLAPRGGGVARKRLIGTVIVVCLLLVIVGEASAVKHTFNFAFDNRVRNREIANWRSAWAYIDATRSYQGVNYAQGRFRANGVVWQGKPGRTTWRIVYNGSVSIRADDRLIYQGDSNGTITHADVPVEWQTDTLSLAIDYIPAGPPGPGDLRVEMGLYQPTAWGGWQLLPDYRLYPSAPSPDTARAEVVRATITLIGYLGLLMVAAAWLVTAALRTLRQTRREAWLAGGLIVFALVIRLAVVAERAQRDYRFYFIPAGNDNYIAIGLSWLVGERSVAAAYRPPVTSLLVGWFMHLFGPHLMTLAVLFAILGAVAVGLIILAGRIAFGPRTGLLAGLVAALYAPLIFFSATPGLDNLLSSMVVLIALAGAFLARHRSASYAALFGAAIGIAAMVRPSALLLAPAIAIGLALPRDPGQAWRGWKSVLALTSVAAAATLLTIAPLAAANRIEGADFLISGNGPTTIYLGNNRDASGLNLVSQASLVAHRRGDDMVQATLADIMADPAREATLTLHKLGLFFANTGQGNVYDYVHQGIRSSTVLTVLSANGRIGMTALAGLALAGLALLLLTPGRRREIFPWLLVSLVGLTVVGTILFHVAERYRVSILPLLCIAAGVTLDHLAGRIAARRPEWVTLTAVGIAVVFLLVAYFFEQALPPKYYDTGSPPPNAIPLNDDFGGKVRLLASLPIESDHRADGYAYITLYWEKIAPSDRDYWISVQLVDPSGDKVAGNDVIVGSITYPPVGLSRWPDGARLTESYLIDIPADAPPVMDVYALLYDPDSESRLPITTPDGGHPELDWVHLGRLGLLAKKTTPPVPMPALAYKLGDSLKITGATFPQSATTPGQIPIGVRFQADAQLNEDDVIFFHLLDSQGNLVAQSDAAALADNWTTSALIPGVPFDLSRVLDVPDGLVPGNYRLVMGAYRYPSLERLPAADAEGRTLSDGLIELGSIEIR
jgi:4-amino-4-deoxy-L-arabinose transferase-like glycosyltransferase